MCLTGTRIPWFSSLKRLRKREKKMQFARQLRTVLVERSGWFHQNSDPYDPTSRCLLLRDEPLTLRTRRASRISVGAP